MLVNSIPGRQQKTFRLVSEETSLRPRMKVAANPPAVAENVATAWNAGQILELSSGNLVKVTGGLAAKANATMLGVAFESHNATLDECATSGLGTWITNQHIGQTTQFDTTVTAATATAGTRLSISNTGIYEGGFAVVSSTTANIAYVLRMMGDWLEYVWFGQPLDID